MKTYSSSALKLLHHLSSAQTTSVHQEFVYVNNLPSVLCKCQTENSNMPRLLLLNRNRCVLWGVGFVCTCWFLPSECRQLASTREPGVGLITTEWNSSNRKRRHSTCYWTKESRKALDTFISFLHGSRRISLTSLTHSERNYHSRLVPRCVQSLKWLRWWDSGVGAGDQWNVCACVRAWEVLVRATAVFTDAVKKWSGTEASR